MSTYRNKRGERIFLPERLAYLESTAASGLLKLRKALSDIGANLYLSDAYRSRADQEKAYQDYITGKKKAFSPPPGASFHEAGRAIDISLSDLGISLKKFWEIAKPIGWKPVIKEPNPRLSEAWHLEFLSYWDGLMAPYNIKKKMSVLECYLENGKYPITDLELRYLVQSYLSLLGLYVEKIDGVFGKNSLKACEKLQSQFGIRYPLIPVNIIQLIRLVRTTWVQAQP